MSYIVQGLAVVFKPCCSKPLEYHKGDVWESLSGQGLLFLPCPSTRAPFSSVLGFGGFGFFLHISEIFYFYSLKYQEWQFLIYLNFGMKWPYLSSSFTSFIIVIESALKSWKELETTCRIAVNLYAKLITLKFCYCCYVIFSDDYYAQS